MNKSSIKNPYRDPYPYPEAPAVVLVHGLWLHGAAFVAQRRRLVRNGFFVRTFSYPSVRRDLDENSRALSAFLVESDSETIDLVGHSLGGLIILNMLEKAPDPRIRRLVLLGSPCAGSHCAEALLRRPGLSTIAGRSLRDAVMRAPWRLPAGIEAGVIAGNRSIGFGRIIPGLPFPNDGTVALAETRLAGSRDAITLPVSHSEMLVSSSCAMQVIHFLQNGQFRHA